jgi:hypothetical protein
MGLHQNSTNVHVVCAYVYADAAARAAATGFAAADVGKFAWQQDDDTIWILTDDSPITWAQVGGAASGGLVDYDIQRYAAGSITLNSTSWADVSGPADLSVNASTGDLIEVGVSFLWGSENLEAYLDFASIVAASPVNYISGGTAGASNRGVVGWQALQGSVNTVIAGSILYVVQAGDISGGTVTLRLRYRTSSGADKTLFATSDIPFHLFVKNLGQ